MPLDARKIAHIMEKWPMVVLGRQQQIVLTLRTNAGNLDITVPVLWKVMDDRDPTLTQENHVIPAGLGGQSDAVGIFLQSDVTYQQLRGCIFAQLAPGSPAPDVATKFILAGIEPYGIIPGQGRYYTLWQRQH